MLNPLIEEVKKALQRASSTTPLQNSLDLLLTNSPYGCQKAYPVALVHEKTRIKDDNALDFYTQNNFLDEDGFTLLKYSDSQIEQIVLYAPSYIQRVNFMIASSKEIPQPVFSNKFKHDYWKKIQDVSGLEALVDITVLESNTTDCEAEAALRAIIRKRKEVHQLKKLTFIWIVEIAGENTQIETVMKHYFEADNLIVVNDRKTYYIGWSEPLQNINMRYFVCPPA